MSAYSVDLRPVDPLTFVQAGMFGVPASTSAEIRRVFKVPLLSSRLVRERDIDSTVTQIRSPGDAARLVAGYLEDWDRENFGVILLNTRNRAVGVSIIYVGSLNATVLRMADLFKPAIVASAAALICFHNHPSGDPSPSPEDVSVTRQIIEAGRLLDIDVLDHIVLGAGRSVSLKERGLAFQ